MIKAILHSLFGLALAGAIAVAAACSGGAGSSLTACPSPNDVAPGGFCTDGQSCPSAVTPDDCPGAAGALICNCTASGWVCVDPSGSECFPDAGDEGGTDEGGTDDGGTDDGGSDDGSTDDGSTVDGGADAASD